MMIPLTTVTAVPDPRSQRALSAMAEENARMEAALEVIRKNAELKAKAEAAGIEMVRPPPTWKELALDVAERHSITVADLTGPSHARWAAWPRQELMAILYDQRKPCGIKRRWSLPQIGHFLGGRDHCTVFKGIARHKDRLDKAAALRALEPRPKMARLTPGRPATVCMLPPDATCPGCGAPAGEPCLDGARRG
jgi:chromosomal replication initiation ATPase DnaA